MIILPLRTDVPNIHHPWATAGLILVNIAIHVWLNGQGDDTLHEWALSFAQIVPSQWLTWGFVHYGIMHLLGNMLFLWIFGQVVEGRLGWWRYLALYLSIDVVSGALVQSAMITRGAVGEAGGASGVIFGLLSICLLWAPNYRVTLFVWFMFFRKLLHIRFLWVGTWYLGWEVVSLIINGTQPSSALLHFSGVVLAVPIGVLMVRQRWVDCDGGDIFTWWHTRHMSPAETLRFLDRRESGEPDPEPVARPATTSVQRDLSLLTLPELESRIAEALARNDHQAAWVHILAARRHHPLWRPDSATLDQAMFCCWHARQGDFALDLATWRLRLDGRDGEAAHLIAASVLAGEKDDPHNAADHLAAVDRSQLSDEGQAQFDQASRHVERRIRRVARRPLDPATSRLLAPAPPTPAPAAPAATCPWCRATAVSGNRCLSCGRSLVGGTTSTIRRPPPLPPSLSLFGLSEFAWMIIPLLVVAGFFLLLPQETAQDLAAREAKAENAHCPQQIDPVTRLDQVSAHGGQIEYRYTILIDKAPGLMVLGTKEGREDRKEMVDSLRTACETGIQDQIRGNRALKMLFARGLTLCFVYRTSTGDELFRIEKASAH